MDPTRRTSFAFARNKHQLRRTHIRVTENIRCSQAVPISNNPKANAYAARFLLIIASVLA
jgi:hypothetical protein